MSQYHAYRYVAVLCAALIGVVPAGAAEDELPVRHIGNFQLWTVIEVVSRSTTSILIDDTEEKKQFIAQKLPDGVYQAETNCFVLKTGDAYYLFDTGFGLGNTINAALVKIGIDADRISGIFITHSHRDHIGGLQKDGYTAFPNATLYVSQAELVKWGSSPDAQKLFLYKDRIKMFDGAPIDAGGSEIVQGIFAVSAEGHTVGHTCFLLQSGKQRLLVIGDLVHVQDVQFEMPEISVTYDADAAQAAAVRREILEYAAKRAVPIAGMHLRAPAAGTVKQAKNGFVFTPAKK
ncbi:MAG: MBL fold metallo-hydrolase [Spirochaetaceae bacterium]|jgi:glyoxylase-like metal-dependent hydrolase (beta-lactamase superfamily II)|nr:MBL fold metallo-hydrolase [Spirochaetaceae bacterium]